MAELSAGRLLTQIFANASGDTNIVIDGSAASTNFFCSCPADTEWLVHTIIFEIEDEKAMEPDEYGSLGGSLSAGISIKILSSDSTVLSDLMGGSPVKTNGGLLRYFDDVRVGTLTNTTNALITGQMNLDKNYGGGVRLKSGQRLNIEVNDDFTGLIEQFFVIRGTKL